MRSLPIVFALSFVACKGEDAEQAPLNLEWSTGDTFHVGAKYKQIGLKTEKASVAIDSEEAPEFGSELWSDELVWTYQVVETGLVPDSGDELYPYSQTPGGTKSLAVIKAWLDASLNGEDTFGDSDPVFYLVFHEDRDRLAAVIQYVNVDGERESKGWTADDLGRAGSSLSQTNLAALPTFLAPFGARAADEERVYDDGQTLTTELTEEGATDVYYEDSITGGMVVSRYEDGLPWPSWTLTDTVEARLLTDEDVAARRGSLPFLYPEDPGSFDYRAALRSSVNLTAALKLDAATMTGGFTATAKEGYRPWSGSWWRQSEGALVFGYDGRNTYSDRVKSEIDPLMTQCDQLQEQLREMDKNSAEYATKVAEYQTKWKEVQTKLSTFYTTLLQDLNGGRVTFANGRMTHADGWSYALNDLSPMDKIALQMWSNGGYGDWSPFSTQQWELLNHYSPAGGSWWGHCNGWSAAAILTNEPRSTYTSTIRDQTVTWTTADIKGLLTESHYGGSSHFYGQRYNDKNSDITDLSPKAFHTIIAHYVRDRQVPLVFDTTANEEVWNFPAYAANVTVVEKTVATADSGSSTLVNVNTATVEQIDAIPNVNSNVAKAVVAYREQYGAFQKVDDLIKVNGIGNATLKKMKPYVTIVTGGATGSTERTFEVTAKVSFATDGVAETYVESNPNAPQGFVETYKYTLVTDATGTVLRGTWADNNKHPDFAWVPYDNTLQADQGGENPGLWMQDIIDVTGTALIRH